MSASALAALPDKLPSDFYRGIGTVAPKIELLSCWRIRLKGWRYPNLQAPYWRFYRNGDDHGRIAPHGQWLPLRRGKVYLIAPETPFGSALDGECDHFFIHFLAPPPYDHCRDLVLELPETEAMGLALERITAEQNYDFITPVAAMAALSLISAALMRLPAEELTAPRPDPRLLPVAKMMREQPERRFTNAVLAEAAGMSVNALIRWFRTGFGVSPQQYLAEERLRRACFLLQYSSLSIEEIAEKTGFCDRFYFTRMFTRYRRISPAEFRRSGPLR